MVELGSRPHDELDSAPAPDVQATFCATLVDEWLRLGVRHAVVAPGSRSTPMALALAARRELTIHVVHDERVAGFTALGLGVDGDDGPATPALLLCTSGTAAANFYPAVVEAGLSELPMIVLTADRPEELRGVGAPQTIDQIELYGDHVRWFHDPGVADAVHAGRWRPLARTARAHARLGPVQLNLPFREPLVGAARTLPSPIDPIAEASGPTRADPVPECFDTARGVILVGGRHGVEEAAIIDLHRRTEWPIIADPLSGLRRVSTVTSIDALLRSESFAAEHAVDTVVRIGRPAASKVLAHWSAAERVTLVQVGGPGRIDPAHNVAAVCLLSDLIAADPAGATGTTWLADWERAEHRAATAIRDQLESSDLLTEPAVARILADHLPPSAPLTVSSSMPVRDLEWFGGHAARAHCNRGANGIDGVMSTAVGRSLAAGPDSPPGFVLIGDLAFVHDSNALVALNERGIDLRIVVVDNDGGGIFSFLPQADLLPPDRFEQLFGTPLGTDVVGIASAHGIEAVTVTTRHALVDQLDRPGPWVCRVPSDRRANVRVHRAIHAAVADALVEPDTV